MNKSYFLPKLVKVENGKLFMETRRDSFNGRNVTLNSMIKCQTTNWDEG